MTCLVKVCLQPTERPSANRHANSRSTECAVLLGNLDKQISTQTVPTFRYLLDYNKIENKLQLTKTNKQNIPSCLGLACAQMGLCLYIHVFQLSFNIIKKKWTQHFAAAKRIFTEVKLNNIY